MNTEKAWRRVRLASHVFEVLADYPDELPGPGVGGDDPQPVSLPDDRNWLPDLTASLTTTKRTAAGYVAIIARADRRDEALSAPWAWSVRVSFGLCTCGRRRDNFNSCDHEIEPDALFVCDCAECAKQVQRRAKVLRAAARWHRHIELAPRLEPQWFRRMSADCKQRLGLDVRPVPLPSSDRRRRKGNRTLVVMREAAPSSPEPKRWKDIAPDPLVSEWSLDSAHTITVLGTTLSLTEYVKPKTLSASLRDETSHVLAVTGAAGVRSFDPEYARKRREQGRVRHRGRDDMFGRDVPALDWLLRDYKERDHWAARLVHAVLQRLAAPPEGKLTRWGALEPAELAGCDVPTWVQRGHVYFLFRTTAIGRRGGGTRRSPSAAIDLLVGPQRDQRRARLDEARVVLPRQVLSLLFQDPLREPGLRQWLGAVLRASDLKRRDTSLKARNEARESLHDAIALMAQVPREWRRAWRPSEGPRMGQVVLRALQERPPVPPWRRGHCKALPTAVPFTFLPFSLDGVSYANVGTACHGDMRQNAVPPPNAKQIAMWSRPKHSSESVGSLARPVSIGRQRSSFAEAS